jgi:hypothetical protein
MYISLLLLINFVVIFFSNNTKKLRIAVNNAANAMQQIEVENM